jgi:hypothetical protein
MARPVRQFGDARREESDNGSRWEWTLDGNRSGRWNDSGGERRLGPRRNRCEDLDQDMRAKASG